MRLPSVPTLPMIEHLNTAYFDTVWNASDDHGATNFTLEKQAQRLQSGMVPVNLSVVGLPTTGVVYAVYRAARRQFGRYTSFPANTWITDQDLASAQSMGVSAFSADGRVIPASQIHLYHDPLRSIVLIAISAGVTLKCTGKSYPDLFMTLYRDTTRKTPVTSSFYKVSTSFGSSTLPVTVTNAIHTAALRYPAGTIVYVNGYLYNPNTAPALSDGDIVSIVSDPDIVGYCDILVDDSNTGYFSTLYGEYREILHIAKALNPTNVILSNDTIMVGIFDVKTNRGVYGHKVDPHAIESITHNDFSIGRRTLQAFQNGLGAQSVKIRIYVRYPTDPMKLGDDFNHLSDLYSLTDSEIRLQLAGLSSHQIANWQAASLEQSPFLDLLYTLNGFDAASLLPSYVSAMGYYDVAAKLAQTIRYYTYKGGEVEIFKPLRLIGSPCQILVYADGRKISEDAIILTHNTSSSFTLSFATESYVKLGSRICVYITEGASRVPFAFNPTLSKPSVTLPSDDYQLVKIVSYSQDKPVWGGTVRKGYHRYPVSPGDYTFVNNPDGTTTLTVSSLHYGESFYLVPDSGMTTAVYDLDPVLDAKQPILIPLLISDTLGNPLPQIGQNALEVYINGYRLIENIDYTCIPFTGDYDDVLQLLLEVSNQDYLDLVNSGNILEVIAYGDQVESSDTGYVISNIMHRHEVPMVWNKGCGRAFVKGLLVEDVHEQGNAVVSSTLLDDGSPYLLEWSLPYGVKKLLKGLSPSSDIDLRAKIFNVLNLTPIAYPDTVLISHLHALYSPYLAAIITDVANGVLHIVDEKKDDLFLKQFSAYSPLAKRDPTLGLANKDIDRRFVTIGAHYANFAVQDPRQMILVQRLIALVLTPANLAINEVLL